MNASSEAELRGARAAWSRALSTTPGPVGREGEILLSQDLEQCEQRLLAILLCDPRNRQHLVALRDALEQGDVRIDDLSRALDRNQSNFEEAAATLQLLTALDAVVAVASERAATVEAITHTLIHADLARPALRKLCERIVAAMGVNGLSPEADRARRAALRAKSRFVHANVRLVAAIARKPEFQDRGLEPLDLVQEGTFGLMQAVDNFDYRRGFKFSTYATWWVRQALQRAVAEHSRCIRLPFGISELLYKINRINREHAVRYGREASHEDIAAALEVPVERIRTAVEASRIEPTSLQTPIGDNDDGQLGDLIPDPTALVADEVAIRRSVSDGATAALAVLKPREQAVIRQRFGLDDGRERTLQDIADDLGLTRERIRQIEGRALAKLRDAFRSIAGGELVDL